MAVPELIQLAERALRLGPREALTGQLEGLRSDGCARMSPGPDESTHRHAGYLAGHLLRWLSEHGTELEGRATLQAAAYAAALADPAGQRELADADPLVRAHLYAAIRCEKATGTALTESLELALIGWLLEQVEAGVPAGLTAKVIRLRLQRHERLGY